MSNLIQQIKIAQKAAGIDQDTHQLNVSYICDGRVNTCTGLTKLEQQQLLARYRAMNPNAGKTKLPAQLKMIYSLWGQLSRAGAVNIDSKQACDTFCEKHLQGKKLSQSAQQWPHIIEVLKQWLARHKAKQGA
ncbi:MAG: hypothetical protein ACI85L_001968 [Pseudomonadota bacterium]